MLICQSLHLDLSANKDDELNEKAQSMLRRFKERPAPEDIQSEEQGLAAYYEFGTTSRRNRALRQNCFADEWQTLQIERELLFTIEEDFALKNSSSFSKHFAGIESFDDLSNLSAKTRQIGNIEYSQLELAKTKEASSRSLLDSIEKLLRGFSEIQNVSFTIHSIQALKKDRETDFSIKNASLLADLKINGFVNSIRRTDRFRLTLVVVKLNRKWKLSSIKFHSGIRLQNQLPSFREVELPSVDEALRYERTRGVREGYALSVFDLNGDGNLDIYAASPKRGFVLTGKGDGSFSEGLFPKLTSYPHVRTAIFGKWKNNSPGVYVLRFGEIDSNPNKVEFFGLSSLDSSKRHSELQTELLFNPLVSLLMVDKNSPPAPYVALPYSKTRLLQNLDSCKKIELCLDTVFTGSPAKWQQNVPYSSASKLEGLDNLHAAHELAPPSARQRRLVALDRRGNLLLFSKEHGRKLNVKSLSDQISGFGNGLDIGDLNGDGILDVVSSNYGSQSFERMAKSCEANWEINDAFINLPKHLSLYMGSSEGGFQEFPLDIGNDTLSEGIGAIKLLDYNNDGLLDLYLGSGLWTGAEKTEELGSFMYAFADGAIGDYFFGEGDSSPFGFMQFLNKLKIPIFSPSPTKSPSFAGHQRNQLFRALEDGSFLEVGFLEGIDSKFDSYSIATGDFNNDGLVDVVLRNAGPPPGQLAGKQIQLFLNQNTEGNNSLKLQFVGPSQNREAIGLRMTGELAGRKLIFQIRANDGLSQSSREIIVGMGKNRILFKPTILWPNGSEVNKNNLKSGVVRLQQKY